MRLLLPRVTTWWNPGLSSRRRRRHHAPRLAAPIGSESGSRSLGTFLAQFGDGGCRPAVARFGLSVITSVDNPRVKEVLRLRKARARRAAGLFVAEGPREVARARAAGLTVVATYFAPALIAWDEGEEVDERVLREDGLPRRAGRRRRRRRDPAPRRPRATARCCSSRSGSRSPATSARWRVRPTPPAPTPCSSATRSATRGTRTRSARRPAPSSRCRSSRRPPTTSRALPHQKVAAVARRAANTHRRRLPAADRVPDRCGRRRPAGSLA